MANKWKVVKDKQGQAWLINWAQFNNVIAAYSFMRAFKDSASVQNQKIDWGFDIKTVDFNHSKLVSAKKRYINKLVSENVRQLTVDGSDVFKNLARYRELTATLRTERADLFAQVQSSANSSMAWAEAALATTQLTRDVAISTIAIIGIPAGGTVALSAVAFNSLGSAFAKYQDTGNVDAALIAGTGALVMCGAGAVTEIAKEGKAALDAGGKILVVGGIVLDCAFEYAGALAEKKSGAEAGKGAFVKAVLNGIGLKIENTSWAKGAAKQLEDHFENLAGKIIVEGGYYADGMKAVTNLTSVEATKKGIEKGVGMYLDSKSKKRISHRAFKSGPTADYIAGKVLQPITIR